MILTFFYSNKTQIRQKISFISILFLVFNFSFSLLQAQKISYPKNQIGIGYSSFSGTGINYLLEIDKTSALQFAGIGYYFGENPPDDLDFYGIMGAEYQHTILREENSRTYGFLGVSMLYLEKRRKTTEKINDKIIIEKKIDIDRIYNFGIGVGYEYKALPNLSTSINLGLLYQLSDKSVFSEFWDRNPIGTSYTGVGIALAIRYVF